MSAPVAGMKIRLLILALLAAFAAGCQSHGAGAATARNAASSMSAGHHHRGPCGLPRLNPRKHRSRAQAERYAARALRCARRHHRHVYYPYPGDRVCLTSAFTLDARSGDVGAAIQGWPVTATVAPGQTRALPPVWIENNGDQAETMTLHIRNLYPYCADVLPPGWVTGTGQPISLAAGQADYVTGLSVHVPAGTSARTYRSDVVVTATTGGSPAAGVGAAFGAGSDVEIWIGVP
jgi:hypothetical protein